MFPSSIKSFKIRRLMSKYRKFRLLLHKNFQKLKTFTKKKLSRVKGVISHHRHEIARQLQMLFVNEKDKPHPLEGVKIKYELCPIDKRWLVKKNEP